jgi:hypothetical protein
MELSSEDALCLNVMLAAGVRAVRINESTMTVYGLTDRGEAAVQLHPTGRPEQYLRLVKETLAEHAMDSPGGYPVHLRRWTRMGQLGDANLMQLLQLGEEEAVVAVVHAPTLTDEVARYAWWAMPTSDNARRMLEKETVAQSEMGRVLAAHLVEHLPFEENPYAIIETVRLLLQPGLIDEEMREAIWKKGRHKTAHYIGFLEQIPDTLPGQLSPRADWGTIHPKLAQLAAHNRTARLLDRVLSGPGQTFLNTCLMAMQRPANQEVVNALLNALGNYFRRELPREEWALHQPGVDDPSLPAVPQLSANQMAELEAARSVLPELRAELEALCALATVSSLVVRPMFARTTAVGALMRTKLEPAFAPIIEQIAVLRGSGQKA